MQRTLRLTSIDDHLKQAGTDTDDNDNDAADRQRQ
jgi:hypothetical protein